MLNLAGQLIKSMKLTMRNLSRTAIEEYNEKSFPVMEHTPSTNGVTLRDVYDIILQLMKKLA